MLFELVLLNLTFIMFLAIVFYFKEYKKSLAIFLVIIVNIFYAPAIYFSYLKGSAYRIFSMQSYGQYLVFSALVFLMLSLFLYWKNKSKLGSGLKEYHHKPNILTLAYMLFVSVIVIGYVIRYIEGFPLYNLLVRKGMIERPDMSGALPFYYSFSTFILFVLPSFYLYYFNKFKSNWTRVILFVLVSILLIMGGNKGVLVYFYLFTWLFIFSAKINYKLVLMVAAAFTAYVAITGGAIDSAIRRFFVTQGSALVVRFDMMNYDFVFNPDIINKQVFWYMYGYKGGSAPSFFAGDFMVHFGYIIGAILTFLVIFIIVLIGKYVDTLFKNSLFVLWSLTVIMYLVGMGSLDFPTSIRVLTMVINVSVVIFLERMYAYFQSRRA